MKKLKKFFGKRPVMTVREWIFYIGMICLSALILTGGVVAKYIWTTEDMNVITAKEFYFTSDLLTESTAEYVLNSTSESVSFTLGNNADKLRYSKDSISYTVTVQCTNGENNAVLSLSSGTLAGDKVSETKITLTGLEQGKTYRVTAVGKAGYEQTLSALFTVSDKEENVYKHLSDMGAYLVLTVWTKNVKGNMTLEVELPGLIPDNTDPALAGVNNYDGGVYKALTEENGLKIVDSQNFIHTEYSSYTYRFFRADDSVYTVGDFDVKFTDGVKEYIVSEGTP